MEKTRKIQSILQDVIEGRKDNNEATIDILALCDVSQQRELLKTYTKWLNDKIRDEDDLNELIDDYFDSL